MKMASQWTTWTFLPFRYVFDLTLEYNDLDLTHTDTLEYSIESFPSSTIDSACTWPRAHIRQQM